MYVFIEKVFIIRHKYRGLYLQKLFGKTYGIYLCFMGYIFPHIH